MKDIIELDIVILFQQHLAGNQKTRSEIEKYVLVTLPIKRVKLGNWKRF